VGLALSLSCPPARALLQSCTASATPVMFGTYTITNMASLAGSGTVTVTCTVTLIGLLEAWTIALSAGNSGTFAQRRLQNGTNALLYNLYTSPALTTVWGDGTGGSSTVSDLQLLSIGTGAYPYTVYGLLTPLQDKPAGPYSDTITVTVNYQ
jgi:spore coat protein U-like protein